MLIADFQTHGAGRLGRSWMAPPQSSLLMSFLVRRLRIEDAFWALAAVAVAVAEACELVADVGVSIKWPNDLLVGELKVAGILAQRVDQAMVVGLGLNVNWPLQLPPSIGEKATSLNHLRPGGRHLDRVELAGALIEATNTWMDRVPRAISAEGGDQGHVVLVEQWRKKCVTLGQKVRVLLADQPTTATEPIVGTAVDVDATGQLVVKSKDRTHVLSSGDVFHLRTAEASRDI